MNNRDNFVAFGEGCVDRKISHDSFEEISSSSNLLYAWREFKRGKTKKNDVRAFNFFLEDNLFELREKLLSKNYRHGIYESFYIRDPKLRHIHKAAVRDRVVHQALFQILYSVFDRVFIHNSYSCRVGKGTHRGVWQLEKFARKVTKNWQKPAWALKCDVKKFFENIDHTTLLDLIERHVVDRNTLWLVREILSSFKVKPGKGLPLGNVTSQLFANIYLNELDQFVKRTLREKYYLRYCDDFIIVYPTQDYLIGLVPVIQEFLARRFLLKLHPNKIIVRKISYGIDFLGYIVLPHYTVLRTNTKQRMIKKIQVSKKAVQEGTLSFDTFNHSLESYKGMLKHCKGHLLTKRIQEISGNHQQE